MNRKLYLCATAVWGMMVTPLPLAAQTAYEVIDRNTLGDNLFSFAAGINESGQVVEQSGGNALQAIEPLVRPAIPALAMRALVTMHRIGEV